jgi:catechol 2,3-dioxygenase-like lactoylglutathione lyase family enzyme
MLKRMDHIGISVSDLDRSIKFYRDLFGMRLLLRQRFCGGLYERILDLPGAAGEVARVESVKTGLQLELFQFSQPSPKPTNPDYPVSGIGISHFCFGVSDINDEYERLRAKGVRFHCPPLDFGDAIATYARDPDGNVFELFERKANG